VSVPPASQPELLSLRSLAERAARRGGELIAAAAAETGSSSRGAVEKGAGDYVTEVDVASERAISALLARETPDVPTLGEEQGGAAGADRRWVVDPLDGTTNFVHGFWAVGVSVALVDHGRPVVGAVHAPLLGATWVAARGLGAFAVARDGTTTTLSVSERPVAKAVVATGFPFRRKELLGRYLATMESSLRTFEDLRRPGAASLDLAWVAAGVFDGYFELALSAWDVAAGGLLVQEAGGVVTDWDDGGDWLSGDILAAPPAVHAKLVDLARTSPGSGG
jgi:myo-inositol-1(or 4)-monophosphatase